jgi:hypothetical protein
MMFKTGLKAPRPGAMKMKFAAYAPKNLPARPAEYGHEDRVKEWHMLGNDQFGCCAFSGSAHEHYLLTATSRDRSRITTLDVLRDYAECTGFDAADISTDQGTDMEAAAKYRRTKGIRDALGKRHKTAAYAEVRPGHLEDIENATWLFQTCALGVTVGQRQQEQFSAGEPWNGLPGADASGHYVPVCAKRGGLFYVVTWGKLHPVTPQFIEQQCDQACIHFSPDMLRDDGSSVEGFKMTSLLDDLKTLTA